MRRGLPLFALLAAAGCGGTAPGQPSPAPTPTPVPVHPVSGFVFYDEDGNGQPDSGEETRLANVTFRIGGAAATTGPDGRFLAQAPEGTDRIELDLATFPPYWTPGSLAAVSVPVPAGFDLPVPVTLPIGTNQPHFYMAFGDSITSGDGSAHASGYRGDLAEALRARWGRADVVNEGVPGTKSEIGADRLGDSLVRVKPAYTLILYGTNDWNIFACRDPGNCGTVRNLRSMIHTARAAGSLPIIGTLPPVNPLYSDRFAEDRNAWTVTTNGLIRTMVHEENVPLAEVHAAMLAESPDLRGIFSDFLHPNERGYAAIARAFFQAITGPRGPASSPGSASP